jgi:hypothetical protein
MPTPVLWKTKPEELRKIEVRKIAAVFREKARARNGGGIDLKALASDINAEHIEGRADVRRGVQHFHKCGLLLTQAKAEVKRRGMKWGRTERNTLRSGRVAPNGIRLSRNTT